MTTAPVLLLTPRDRDVFRDVYRFGCLSAAQLALRHWPDSVSDKTARNRLWQLCQAGYLERRPIGHREDGAYLLTPKGRTELGLPTKHARPDPRASSSLRHRLIVADVADWFLARRYRGGAPEWVSEVDVYDGRFRLAGRETRTRRRGALMVPDGVLVLRGGERVWRLAVEVELHQKASRLYDAKLAWYARQFAEGTLDGCEWLCAGAGRAGPILAAARRAAPGSVGLVAAGPLPEDVTPY
ncbi:MAG TPA: replication-relaxation family protein [Chloroflexota bacterium]|nr:replication-relaxation family protein [Chloroflexota bacterium]